MFTETKELTVLEKILIDFKNGLSIIENTISVLINSIEEDKLLMQTCMCGCIPEVISDDRPNHYPNSIVVKCPICNIYGIPSAGFGNLRLHAIDDWNKMMFANKKIK